MNLARREFLATLPAVAELLASARLNIIPGLGQSAPNPKPPAAPNAGASMVSDLGAMSAALGAGISAIEANTNFNVNAITGPQLTPATGPQVPYVPPAESSEYELEGATEEDFPENPSTSLEETLNAY